MGAKPAIAVRREHPIGPYIVDFYVRSAGLVIEIDGAAHESSDAREYDRERDAYMAGLGLRIERISADEVERNPIAVVKRIVALSSARILEDDHGLQWVEADRLAANEPIYPYSGSAPVSVSTAESTVLHERVVDIETRSSSIMTVICAVGAI